ncbi:MAG: hypothetical protein ABIH41_03780, partial [Nanoarchaeota archaeon]
MEHPQAAPHDDRQFQSSQGRSPRRALRRMFVALIVLLVILLILLFSSCESSRIAYRTQQV